ncbi:EamA family transporter [Uliginosibacterium sp. H3]|uniref:EamA family transporter n=1 Tax=Uliginosibacterium silvisoli TaxID=3114758 RepID=A0ABU6JY78_9RHOO|nr:EamA family transporter [Uliginosibacterium sp. H3]
MREQPSNAALYLGASLIWGSTWLAITFQYGVVPATASVAYRFLLAGVLLLLWSALRGERMRLGALDLAWAALQGVLLFGLSYSCVYEAERYIPSGLMAVLNSSMLPFNIIGMRLAFGRRFTAQAVVGAALGVLGIVLVFWPELAVTRDASSWRGIAFGLVAGLLASLGNLAAQRNRNAQVPLLSGTGISMLVGGGTALLITLSRGQDLVFDLSPGYIASLLYLAVFGSVLAFAAYLTLMGRIGAGRAGYIAVAVPILALLLSAWFEDFDWSWWTFAGITCAVAGNAIVLAEAAWLAQLWQRLRHTPGP